MWGADLSLKRGALLGANRLLENGALRDGLRLADWQSAKRQVSNLRYNAMRVRGAHASGVWCLGVSPDTSSN
jgi:hypothetical protein